MSRTYKKRPQGYFRGPRGHKRAVIQGARDGAIPPDPWDDKPIDKQAWVYQTVAEQLVKKQVGDEHIIRRLRNKFGLSQWHAEDTVKRAKDRVDWLKVYTKRMGKSREEYKKEQEAKLAVAMAAAERLKEVILKMGASAARSQVELMRWAYDRGADMTYAYDWHNGMVTAWYVYALGKKVFSSKDEQEKV